MFSELLLDLVNEHAPVKIKKGDLMKRLLLLQSFVKLLEKKGYGINSVKINQITVIGKI